MATVYGYMKPHQQVISFAGERIYELKQQIEQAQLELEMWERIRAQHQPCGKCGGAGRVVDYWDGPECHTKSCAACEGSGSRLDAVQP